MASSVKDITYDEGRFRAALAEESDYPLTGAIYDYIVANSELMLFQKGEPVIDIGQINPDVYIVCDGIIRGYVVNGDVETNFYFGLEGTFVTSMQGFSAGAPAIIKIEACCPTTVLRIRKSTFDLMLDHSNDFLRWVAGVFTRRSYFDEMRKKIMSGDAKWRYEWLERCRPELFEHVPLKAIASYLSMTEVHISRIRKMIAKQGKTRQK